MCKTLQRNRLGRRGKNFLAILWGVGLQKEVVRGGLGPEVHSKLESLCE